MKKRISSNQDGYIGIKLSESDEVYEDTLMVSSCRPDEKKSSSVRWELRKFISIGVARMFEYTDLTSIERIL